MTTFFPGLSSYSGSGYASSYSGNTYGRVTNTDISDLIRYIETGNAKQVMEKYQNLNASGNQNLRNRIETYFARYYGQDLTTTLDKSAGSSFVSGLKQGTLIAGIFDDGLSGDEVEAMITGVDESTGSKVAEYAGGILSSAGSTALVTAAAIGIPTALKCAAAGTAFGPAGTIAGAIVGGIVGAVTGVIKVAFNDAKDNKQV